MAAFFAEQNPDGTWVCPCHVRIVCAIFFDLAFTYNAAASFSFDGLYQDKGQPIYKSFRRTGRDVGNAFVFAADTVGSLLAVLPAEEFRPHLDGLQKLVCWAEEHSAVEIIYDYCDPITSQCFGKPLRGWASPHMTTQACSPLAW